LKFCWFCWFLCLRVSKWRSQSLFLLHLKSQLLQKNNSAFFGVKFFIFVDILSTKKTPKVFLQKIIKILSSQIKTTFFNKCDDYGNNGWKKGVFLKLFCKNENWTFLKCPKSKSKYFYTQTFVTEKIYQIFVTFFLTKYANILKNVVLLGKIIFGDFLCFILIIQCQHMIIIIFFITSYALICIA
jgi:hypothetical protein